MKLLALVGGLAAFPAHATNGMRMIGFGPVQTSMGGVGVGATLDAAAIVTNPAGIADQEARLDVGLGLFVPKPSYNATGIDPSIITSPGQRIETTRGPSPIPFVGLVLPLSPDLKLGLSFSAVAGMGVTYPSNLYSSPTNTNYLQARFTPALGYRVGDTFSVGAGLNVMVAMMDWNVASAFAQQPHDRATALGLGGVIGVKVKPDPVISFGAAYETPSWFGDFGWDIPAHDTAMGPLPAAKEKLTFNQPMTATIGVAVMPFAGADDGPLVIAADVEWINWSWSNGRGKPAFSTDSLMPGMNGMMTNGGSMTWDLDWRDQWVFKIGAQVAVAPSLQVRLGYNYGQNPLDPNRAFENLAFPAVQEHHFTAGIGIQATERLVLNLGGMYAPTSSVSGANPLPPLGTPGYPGPYGQGIAAYSTRMQQLEVDAGIAYRF